MEQTSLSGSLSSLYRSDFDDAAPGNQADHRHGSAPATVDNAPPTHSKVTGALADAACCAIPLLIAAGLLTGAAVLQQTLVAMAAGLAVLALGMWWLHRRRSARAAATTGAGTGCGDDNCPC